MATKKYAIDPANPLNAFNEGTTGDTYTFKYNVMTGESDPTDISITTSTTGQIGYVTRESENIVQGVGNGIRAECRYVEIATKDDIKAVRMQMQCILNLVKEMAESVGLKTHNMALAARMEEIAQKAKATNTMLFEQ